MKKNSKQQKNEARIAAQIIAEEIITNAKAPSVKALMHRISSLTQAAAQRAAQGEDRAAVFGIALAEIDEAARTFWKQQARA